MVIIGSNVEPIAAKIALELEQVISFLLSLPNPCLGILGQ